MIHDGWFYLSQEQYQRTNQDWQAIQSWLAERGLLMDESWGVPPHSVEQRFRIMLFPVDAREDFDRDTALFEFKMTWL